MGECAGGSGDWVEGRKVDVAHALEDLRGGCGGADIPVFVLRVGADDQKVVRCGDAAVAGASWKDGDIARVDGDGLATFSAENEVGMATGKAKDFVCGGVVVVEVVDAVAPLRRPSVSGEEPLHRGGKIVD